MRSYEDISKRIMERGDKLIEERKVRAARIKHTTAVKNVRFFADADKDLKRNIDIIVATTTSAVSTIIGRRNTQEGSLRK